MDELAGAVPDDQMFVDAVYYFADVGRDGKRLDGDLLANVHQSTFGLLRYLTVGENVQRDVG